MECSLAQIDANRMYLHNDDPPCQKLPVAEAASGAEKALDLGVQSAAKEASLFLRPLCVPRRHRLQRLFSSFPGVGRVAAYLVTGVLSFLKFESNDHISTLGAFNLSAIIRRACFT
jgi:hypothetical protein